MFVLIPMIIVFWLLDSYYLWQERLFREIYNDVRVQSDTDFAMNVGKHFGKKGCRYWRAVFSVTILGFYAVEGLIVLLAWMLVC